MDINSLKGFTPGPWHEGRGNGEGFIFGPEGTRRNIEGLASICHINGQYLGEEHISGPEDGANSWLIASAPDLLTLARMGLELADYFLNPPKTDSFSRFNEVMAEKARALKEKAEAIKD